MTRWGKAGVRLTATDIATRRRAEGLQRLAAARRDREAFDMWRAGQLVPYQITLALDMNELDGPEVDIACGAREPDVDLWEQGRKYPTWEQTQRLAALTEVSVQFLCRSVTAAGPLCPKTAKALAGPPPVMRFDPHAVIATLRAAGLLPEISR